MLSLLTAAFCNDADGSLGFLNILIPFSLVRRFYVFFEFRMFVCVFDLMFVFFFYCFGYDLSFFSLIIYLHILFSRFFRTEIPSCNYFYFFSPQIFTCFPSSFLSLIYPKISFQFFIYLLFALSFSPGCHVPRVH